MERKTNKKLVTAGIFIATFMTAIEGTIVTTAMPTIVSLLHGTEIMNWVFSIYLLTNAMMTPIYGKLADKIGRKPVFIAGIAIFVVGSALCGISNSMMTLIVSRAIQGIGAGAIMPVALTIIADMYDLEQRTKILGLNNAAWGISSVLGPLAGGLIVDTIGWHWIFFINVPIGIVLIFLIQYFLVEEKRRKSAKKMDFFGSISLMLTLVSLLLGFQFLGDNGLNGQVVVLLFLTLLLAGVFFYAEKRTEDPVIDLSLFRNMTFMLVNGVAFLISGFLMGLDVYIPMWMQGVLGKSAAIGGLVMAPLSIIWMLGSFLSGRLLARMAAKSVLAIGLLVIMLGAGILLILPIHSPFWLFFITLGILGLGYGLSITITTMEAQSSVPKNEVGVATSFNTLSRTIGQAVMVSIFGIVMNLQIAHKLLTVGKSNDPDIMNKLINPHIASHIAPLLRDRLREILLNGLHVVYLVGLILIVLAFVFTLAVGKRRKSDTL